MWENTYYLFKVGVKIYTLMTYCFWRNYVCDSSYFDSDLEAQRDSHTKHSSSKVCKGNLW